MQISQLEINNFGKHAHKTVNFQNGSNLIIGPNYSGKSTIMRAIGIALYGNRMTPIATKLLVKKGAKDFHLKLTVQAEPVGFVVERTSSNSSVTRLGEASPYVVGHTQVNEEVARLLQMPRDTFRKVFLSEQGSPQQLLSMEGAELQRFVESVTELDDLDAMQKLAGQKAAKAKIQAETLESLMLTDDDYTAKKQRVVDMESQLAKGLEEQTVLEESHAMVKCELDNLQSDISKAIESNKAAEKWYSGKESIKQQIAARPEQELHDTTDLVTQVDALKSKVAALDKEIAADRRLAQQWAVYTSELASLHASREAEQRATDALTFVPGLELEKLRSEITDLENKISTARVNNARIALVTAEFDKARATVAKATDALETHGSERILPDTTEAEAAYKEAHDTWAGLCNDVALLDRVLEEADCPTCKRPWDEHFDRAAKQSELQGAKEKMGLAKVTLDSAIEELQAVKSERVDGQVHNAKYASLFEQVNACRASLATLKVDLDNLPEIVADSQGVLWQQALDLAKSTLVTAEANNVKVDSSLAALAKIELALASVVIPEGARPTDVDSDAKAMLMAATREELTTASAALTDFTTRNTLAQASNSVRITLLSKLKDYPDELDPKLTDVQPLLDKSANLSSQVDTFSIELRKIVATNTSTRLDLQPLKSEVESHESYLTKRAEALAQAKLNSYLGNLIGTHREAFMAKAQATLFEVASEFARLSSDGDIQEVLVHEGNISYKENDQIFPKDTASGSQKSMMGLGMKLGIANLINSDFETFLLDEVSADMSEDISLKCMGALDMLCANSVVITHRPMDVAGNVIDLG